MAKPPYCICNVVHRNNKEARECDFLPSDRDGRDRGRGNASPPAASSSPTRSTSSPSSAPEPENKKTRTHVTRFTYARVRKSTRRSQNSWRSRNCKGSHWWEKSPYILETPRLLYSFVAPEGGASVHSPVLTSFYNCGCRSSPFVLLANWCERAPFLAVTRIIFRRVHQTAVAPTTCRQEKANIVPIHKTLLLCRLHNVMCLSCSPK